MNTGSEPGLHVRFVQRQDGDTFTLKKLINRMPNRALGVYRVTAFRGSIPVLINDHHGFQTVFGSSVRFIEGAPVLERLGLVAETTQTLA